MLVLITYDVSVLTSSGRCRLRHIAKVCLDYGMRVQNSVFECEVDPSQWVTCKNQLLEIYEPQEDSLRFYMLGSKGRGKIEHHGAKVSLDISRDAIVI
ncbi:MAG: CRISPR-associated endonuclease Cas2 [Cytophagales bacterium]|nr:CRISPR-associated endonuclease Cas2 [Cytophagales bacterium]